MKSLRANWKTTAAGVGAILTGLSGLVHLVNPDVPGPDLGTSVVSIVTGIGLIVAKDGNVTGGTTPNR